MDERTYNIRPELPSGGPIDNAILTEEGIQAIAPLLIQLFVAALAVAPEQKGSEIS